MVLFDRERVGWGIRSVPGTPEIPTFGRGRVTPGRPTVRAEEELLGAPRAAGCPVPQQEGSDGLGEAWSPVAA